MTAQPEFQQRFESIERLIREIETASDPDLCKTAKALVQAVMDLQGTALERLLEIVHAAGEPGQAIIDGLARDELVSSVLVLYGLHPLGIEDRVRLALEKVEARVRPSGGAVGLISMDHGAVRVKIQANGHGHGSAQSLKQSVEEAVYQAAPDITSLEVEGGEQPPGFVPLDRLLGVQPPPASNGHPRTAGEGGL
jgi:hypothetical protein